VRRIYITTGEQEKGRTFQAVVLAVVEAKIWDGADGGQNVVRPALISLACTTGEAGPVLANLRGGRKASYSDERHSKAQTLELLKSAGYAFTTQRCAAGVRVDAFLPALFDLSPGCEPGAAVTFVCLPDRAWLAAQAIDVGAAVEHVRAIGGLRAARYDERPTEADVAELAPYAPIFAKHLLARSRLPLIPEIGFLTQVLVAALARKLARRAWGGYGCGYGGASGYVEVGVADAGYAPGVCFSATEADLRATLAEQTLIYVERRRR
jgi:hypothetical protein